MIKRFVFIGAAFVGVAFFVTYIGTGKKPELSVPKMPDIDIPDSLRDFPTAFGKDDSESQVYKWQDDAGVWHFEETAPAGAHAEEVLIEPINTIDYAKGAPVVTESQQGLSGSSDQSFNPYSADGIEGLLEQAEGIQKVLDERAAQQQNALDSL